MPHRPLALAADAVSSVNDLVALTLTRAGFRVTKAAGPDAIDEHLTADVRLVVLAASRAGESAAELAAAVRARAAPAAVVVLANGNDPAADALAAADPGVRVLHKPFRPTELVAVAQELVG
jgi:DNA-binding response OmpR family regulator